jgi:hypothetical protein
MPPDHLSAADKAILAELLRETIAADRFFLSPRVKSLKAFLAKLEPQTPRPQPSPLRTARRLWRSNAL